MRYVRRTGRKTNDGRKLVGPEKSSIVHGKHVKKSLSKKKTRNKFNGKV